MPLPLVKCPRCNILNHHSQYVTKKSNKKYSYCKACQKAIMDDVVRRRTPAQRMWYSSKANASKFGVEHTITVDDIITPTICRYLGIVIDYRRAPERGRLRSFNAPSIDRIDPTRGYIPGNVQVISDLANRMKQNATIDQLLSFAEGVIRAHGNP